MNMLISLCLAFVFSWYGAKWIKKHANLIYAISAVLSVGMIVITYTDQVVNLPEWVQSYVWPIFANCSLATAFFIVVMITGALKNGTAAIKRLMPIRAELSIMACILTLGHNISYGKTYFVMLFTRPERLSGNLLFAALCSVVLIVIMLPLMVTSFPSIRKKMKAKNWKKLQRSAYVFYALIYIHVMLLNTSFLAAGQTKYLFNILLYSAVFITYAAMRIRKALLKKYPAKAKIVPAALAVATALVVLIICAPGVINREQEVIEPSVTETSAPIESEDVEGTIEAQLTETPAATEDEATIEPIDTEPAAPNVQYKDGNYFGTGEGFNGEVKVAVTIKDGLIDSIIVVSTGDDASYMESAKTLIDDIIASQNAAVDAVSGATYSSQGLIEAIKNALDSAAS